MPDLLSDQSAAIVHSGTVALRRRSFVLNTRKAYHRAAAGDFAGARRAMDAAQTDLNEWERLEGEASEVPGA